MLSQRIGWRVRGQVDDLAAGRASATGGEGHARLWLLVVRHDDGRGTDGIVIGAVRTCDRNRVDPPGAVACAFGPQLHVVGVEDDPVGRSVSVPCPIHRLVTADREDAAIASTVVRGYVIARHIHHLVIRRPQYRLAPAASTTIKTPS